MSGDIVSCPPVGWGSGTLLLASGGSGPGMLPNSLQYTGHPAPQRIIPPYVSVVLGLRNSSLDVL